MKTIENIYCNDSILHTHNIHFSLSQFLARWETLWLVEPQWCVESTSHRVSLHAKSCDKENWKHLLSFFFSTLFISFFLFICMPRLHFLLSRCFFFPDACICVNYVETRTVGYGDITCETEVGRVFQLMFLGVGLVSRGEPSHTSPKLGNVFSANLYDNCSYIRISSINFFKSLSKNCLE